MATAVWRGLDAHRLEIAHVEQAQGELHAAGTQIGVAYEVRYELEPGLLRVEVVGESRCELALDGADFLRPRLLGPLHSLPVVRDRLLEDGAAHDYVLRWVDVPSLAVTESAQRYEGPAERLR